MRNNKLTIVLGAALGTAQLVTLPLAQANGDPAMIDELKQLVRQQQQQIEAQAKALEDLQRRIEGMEQTQDEIITSAASKKTVTSGEDNISLELSGQVNRGVLFIDDGEQTDTFYVDNDNSSTRFRLVGKGQVTEDFSIGSLIEVQMESNSTADVNQNNNGSVGGGSFTERKLEFYLDSKRFGRLAVGQGSTASDNTAEVDLSGVSVIGYSSVADMAGGILFRDKDSGQLTNIKVGNVFTNLDGLGREDRVLYDTPTLGGFQASTSFVTNSRWDLALRYGGDFGAFQTAAAIGYADPNSDTVDYRLDGSFSVLHDSGVNLTAAAGIDKRDDDSDDAKYYYAKVGYIAQWFSWGDTAFALDYYDGENINVDNDQSETYGIFAVQNLSDYGTQFYLGIRSYQYDQRNNNFDNITAALIGARVKF